MGIIGRMAGALVAVSNNTWYLVGDLKEPCDFPGAGFVDPGEIRPMEQPYVLLRPLAQVPDSKAACLQEACLVLDMEGEDLARLASKRFVIDRNGSVSERLWRVATHSQPGPRIDASWLGNMPDHVWNIVRESLLKCN